MLCIRNLRVSDSSVFDNSTYQDAWEKSRVLTRPVSIAMFVYQRVSHVLLAVEQFESAVTGEPPMTAKLVAWGAFLTLEVSDHRTSRWMVDL